ncbi:fas-activated serine/threonine kinase isoform X1 [Podarcis muralis]
MLLLLRALIRGGTGPSAPWADPGGAGLLPTCSFCLGRAKPPASPPEPGPLHPAVAPEGSPERRSSFVALKRLLERSRSVPELLRWLWQNPGRVSGAHYALALGHLGRLLPPGKGGLRLEPLLHQPDFQHLSRAVARRCAHFDDATLVRCLQASAALGLPGDGRLVLALQDEAQRRLERLRQRNVSTVSGNNVRLRPLSHAAATTTPLAEACKGSLEEQRRLQTLFLLLSYYCLRAQKQQEEAPPVRREFLRLVRLSLRQLQVAQEQELALLEEMLCLCAREATGSDTLGAIFGSQLFYQNRRENFVRGMADWFPGKAGGLTPPTMALVAKYLARHRLREPRLLDAIATFLLERAQQLDSKPVELPPVQPRRPLPPPGGGSAEAGRLPAGRPQRPHVLGATWPLPSCPPAPSLLFRLPGQRHQQPLRADCAALPLPLGRGCGTGGPRVPRPPPAPPVPRAHVRRGAHRRRGQPQVQLQRPGGRGSLPAGGQGVLPAGRGGAPGILPRLPALGHPFWQRPPPGGPPQLSQGCCPRLWITEPGIFGAGVDSRVSAAPGQLVWPQPGALARDPLPEQPHTDGPLPGEQQRDPLLPRLGARDWAGAPPPPSGRRGPLLPPGAQHQRRSAGWSTGEGGAPQGGAVCQRPMALLPRLLGPGGLSGHAQPTSPPVGLPPGAAALPGAGENEGHRGDQGLPETEAGGAAILKQTPRCGSVWVTGQRARLGMVWVFPCRAHIPPGHP